MKKILASKRNWAILAMVVFVVVSVGFLYGHYVHAGDSTTPATPTTDDGIMNAIARFLATVINVTVIAFAGFMLKELMIILVWVAQYNDFLTSSAVLIGWPVVRDVVNMFFVIGLLFIAVATILGVEEYHYEKLLSKFLLYAVLVNFSKTISGFIIDIAQVIMLTFVAAFRDATVGNISNALGITALLDFNRNTLLHANEGGTAPGFFSILASIILAAVVLVITDIVILVIVVVLTMRILYLWVLIVMSPLAYLLYVFPGHRAHHYSIKWWDDFINYVVSGPILAFFLWLAFSITASVGSPGQRAQALIPIHDPNIQEQVNPETHTAQGTGLATPPTFVTQAGTTDQIFVFIAVIGLLLVSLSMAEELGVAGGKFAGSMAEHIKHTGLAVGGVALAPLKGMAALAGLGIEKGAGVLYRKGLLETPLKVFTPPYWHGFFKRGERRMEEAKHLAEGAGEERAEIIFKGKKAALPRAEMARRSIINEHKSTMMKELGEAGGGKEKMVELALRAKNTTGHEGDELREAFLELTAERGNLDDVHQILLEKGVINKENYAEWGFDSWTDAKHEDSNSYKKLMMGYLHLNRKYDPNSYLLDEETKRLQQQTPGLSDFDARTQALDTLRTADGFKTVLSRETKYNGKKMTLGEYAQVKAKEAANNSSDHDQDKLRTLYTIGQAVRGVGHWEQVHGQLDAKTSKYYVMGLNEQLGEVQGEAAKSGARKLIQNIAPHAIRPRMFDDAANSIYVSGDIKDMGAFEMSMYRWFPPSLRRDAHQAQPRFWRQGLSVRSAVGDQNPNLEEGGVFNGEEGLDRYLALRDMAEGTTDAAYQVTFFGDAMKGAAPGSKTWRELKYGGGMAKGVAKGDWDKMDEMQKVRAWTKWESSLGPTQLGDEGERLILQSQVARTFQDKRNIDPAQWTQYVEDHPEVVQEIWSGMGGGDKAEVRQRVIESGDIEGVSRALGEKPKAPLVEGGQEKGGVKEGGKGEKGSTPAGGSTSTGGSSSVPVTPVRESRGEGEGYGDVVPSRHGAIPQQVVHNITASPEITNNITNTQNVVNNMTAPHGGGLKGMLNDSSFRKFMKSMKTGMQSLNENQRAAVGDLAKRISLIADAIPDESGISDASIDVAVTNMEKAGIDAGEIKDIVDTFSNGK